MQYITILYGIIGLSFLVFIHELGHFFVARYYGMRVVTFSVGFGPALISWVRDEVEYRIGMIPFGGYVSILGMDEDSEEENSYFKKKPFQRLMMVAAGPFVNLFFAFIGFSLIFFSGGSLKNSIDSSSIVGMVDPKSQSYEKGIRPGDLIESINGQKIQGRKDLFFQAILDSPKSHIKGKSVNYLTGEYTPFSVEIESKKESIHGMDLHTNGLVTPAAYLIYDPKRLDGPSMTEDSPMKNAGLLEGDRIIWVNGELVFSREQLQNILAENSALMTVIRDHQTLQVKVPKISLSEVNLTNEEKEEINDLRFDAKLLMSQEANFIPYVVDQDAIVVSAIKSGDSTLLKPNDRILAVDGIRASTGAEVMQLLQKKHVLTIVAQGAYAPIAQKNADQDFYQGIEFAEVSRLISKIGVESGKVEEGNLRLLASVEPLVVENHGVKTYRLGLSLLDRQVIVNPGPFEQFISATKEIGKVFGHLSQGELSPKYLSGPIGILGVMQKGWDEGFKEGVFWLSTISLNLGLMNLLPLPVLDGGHILFSVYEMVTRKRINKKLMEKILIPFALLLIGFVLFTTAHDIFRIFSFMNG
ncbi:MAG: RIP metalloprotease RseP [Chlamydiia bacterium]